MKKKRFSINLEETKDRAISLYVTSLECRRSSFGKFILQLRRPLKLNRPRIDYLKRDIDREISRDQKIDAVISITWQHESVQFHRQSQHRFHSSSLSKAGPRRDNLTALSLYSTTPTKFHQFWSSRTWFFVGKFLQQQRLRDRTRGYQRLRSTQLKELMFCRRQRTLTCRKKSMSKSRSNSQEGRLRRRRRKRLLPCQSHCLVKRSRWSVLDCRWSK